MRTGVFTPQFKQELVSLYRDAILSNVPIKELEEKISNHRERLFATGMLEDVTKDYLLSRRKAQVPLVMRLGALLVPVVFLSVGLFLVGNAVIPLGSYYLNALPTILAGTMNSPIPPEEVLEITPVVIAQAQEGEASGNGRISQNNDGPIIIDSQLDYTNLANWFSPGSLPNLMGSDQIINKPSVEYTLAVPALKIENAVVKIGGTDLNNNLIQYPGTAEPGQLGAPVIFGHSVLRQFYNPSLKNPRRYNSIFSTIMTLKPGEEILVKKDNVEYRYLVRSKTEVKPEDVHILLQNYDSRQLKLVTCTPEGTYLRRGIVTAELVN